MLALHLAKGRALGTEQEAHRLLGHIESRHVLTVFEGGKVGLDGAAVALLQRDRDGELGQLALLGAALHLRVGRRTTRWEGCKHYGRRSEWSTARGWACGGTASRKAGKIGSRKAGKHKVQMRGSDETPSKARKSQAIKREASR